MSDREIMRSKYETRKPYKDMKQPDAKKHQTVSFIKSAIRIVGYIAIPFNLELATALLISSEIVGIVEELV
tara:strand:- start:1194 stop:1406 length:213 start_codon:yes stop_codon:yes gene_type:complete